MIPHIRDSTLFDGEIILRIGSYSSGLAIQKFDKVQQRVMVQKHIPQYIQIMLYDLNYPNPTALHVEGTIVGSSTSDLATKMQQFRAIVRQKKVVWIDASDAYQGRLDLVRIIKRQGPTVDSSQGILTATFQIDAQILPPWGTTHTNPWRQNGIYFRDLNNVGREYAINPLMNHCNFQINESSEPYSFSWEFIVDNQNPFTSATSVQEASCDSLGSGQASPTNPVAASPVKNNGMNLSIDTSTYVQGSGSLKGNKSSPAASTWYDMGYNFGTSGMNFSSYDRLRLWYRCDQASQTSYAVLILDTSNRQRYWAFSLQAASVWMNVELSLASYTSQDSGFDITKIQYIGIAVETASTAPASINLWVDDIRVEVGYINHCEDTNWTWNTGSNTSLANDTLIFKSSPTPSGATPETSTPSSLKATATSNSNGNVVPVYRLPVSSWDLSGYDFVVVWLRSDFGGSSTGTLGLVFFGSTLDYSNYRAWRYANLNANQWYRLVIPIQSTPTSSGGTANLNAVYGIGFESDGGAANATTNMWIDEIAVDVGLWVNLEFNIPDNVSPLDYAQMVGGTIQFFTWNGSSYQFAQGENIYNGNGIYPGGSGAGFLDGSLIGSVYSNGSSGRGTNGFGITEWPVAPVGTAISASNYDPTPGSPTNLITSQTYGCNNRLTYSIKLPPATSDSVSGNYPSNDVSGSQAIYKVRLKVVVYYSNDDTTYAGM